MCSMSVSPVPPKHRPVCGPYTLPIDATILGSSVWE